MNSNRERRVHLYIWLIFAAGMLWGLTSHAQSGLEGRINQTIDSLVRVVNVLIAGFVVWSGFLIAKGDQSGFQRLIYGIVGLIVANGSYLIVGYFR